MPYILNEKEYIENILASKEKPKELHMGYFMTLISKYYYAEGMRAELLSDTVKQALSEFHLERYQEHQYHKRILAICESLCNGTAEPGFRELESIPIYRAEMNVLESLPNDRQKKFLFTLFAIARYVDCDGWTNKKTARDVAEVFQLANLTLSSQKRNELLHELYVNGYVSFGKKVDNLNMKVRLDPSGEAAYEVREFCNLGNQYVGNFKKGYKQCKTCGKAIRIIGTNTQYCRKCTKEKQLERQRESMRRLRETQMREGF